MSRMLSELLDLLGDGDTQRLIETYGGTRVWVPIGPKVGTLTIATEVSSSVEIALASVYGGMLIQIPLSRDWRADIYHRSGMSRAQIARKLGINENAVRVLLKRGRVVSGKSTQVSASTSQLALPLF